MTQLFGDYVISDDKNLLQINRIHELLSKTYWANSRPKGIIQKSIDNSLCFGLYKDGIQIGFARCITDYAVLYYLADVIIDEKYRGQGLGKNFLKYIIEHEVIKNLSGFLGTNDAHELYERFGFQHDTVTAMNRRPNTNE